MKNLVIALVVLLGFAFVAESADARIFPLFGRRFLAGGNVVRVPGSLGRFVGVRTRVNGFPISRFSNRFVGVRAPFVNVGFNRFRGVQVRAPFVNVGLNPYANQFVSPVRYAVPFQQRVFVPQQFGHSVQQFGFGGGGCGAFFGH